MSESNILDLNRPHTNLGPKDAEGYLWHGQDGWIFNWSESNVQYEKAWWLDQNGIPIEAHNREGRDHVKNICRDRPFDPLWLDNPETVERSHVSTV